MKSLYVFPRRLVASEVRINHHEGIGLGEVSASVGELKLYSASRRGYVVVTASPDWISRRHAPECRPGVLDGVRAMPVLHAATRRPTRAFGRPTRWAVW